MAVSKETAPNLKVGESVVYPGRGVGQVTATENQEVAGFKLEVFVITFSKDNMIIKIPTSRDFKQGLRKVSDGKAINEALSVLAGRARKSKLMWSRRAVELEGKVNSNDLAQLAEVIRDLHRGEGQPEASYSERGIYDNAIALLTQEVSVSKDILESEAIALIQGQLAKAPPPATKGGPADEGDELEKVA